MAHILIIDDDTDIRLLVTMMLGRAGHIVAEASCGAEGLAYLAAHGADCVLLDINMPEMNGWDVCRRIKADPLTAHIPVVIQTVRCTLQDETELASARPDGFINKPFTKEEMLAEVARVMSMVQSASPNLAPVG